MPDTRKPISVIIKKEASPFNSGSIFRAYKVEGVATLTFHIPLYIGGETVAQVEKTVRESFNVESVEVN